MKNKTIIFRSTSLILSLFLFLASQPSEQELLWSSTRKLKWEDFKIIENSQEKYEAISETGIKYGKINWEGGKTKLTVLAIFIHKGSWTKSTSDSLLLIHEQGHFDITELFARKLRKELSNKRIKQRNISKELERLVIKINKKQNDYQKLYDTETNFHIDKRQQQSWTIKIQKELEELKEWENPQVVIR